MRPRPAALVAVAATLVAAAAPARAELGPATVASLARTWALEGPGVTGGPVVRDGRLYVGAWDGRVRALEPATGVVLWERDAGGAVPGRVLALDDGGICYGTFNGLVGCLNGADGTARWTRDLDDAVDPLPAAVWSAPVAANGRLLVGVAGLTDQPCARGRLVALDLATGNDAWPRPFFTVPERVCETDTSTQCATDADCPAGGAPGSGAPQQRCVLAQGAGVTASPIVDPSGQFVYLNTVGCYTFPSVGDSDAAFKLNAADGSLVWKTRVSRPEQFGACTGDTGIDCGVDATCAAAGAGTCRTKSFYHDFGFLNGPLRIEVPDGAGGTRPLVVSGSKNGTLYAFDDATGAIAWRNLVRAEPVTPGFAGFGLFNGAITHAEGRIFAALYHMIPARVCSDDARTGCSSDADCSAGSCPAEPKHLMAFDAATGQTLWAEEIGRSWSHVSVANGVVYAGTQAKDDATGRSWLYAHAAATGERLATFELPGQSTAYPTVHGDRVYVGYGVGSGGLLALSPASAPPRCGNGVLDAGETCDPALTPACCTPACAATPAGQGCDDGDACTSADACEGTTCAGTVATAEGLACSLARLGDAPCGAEALPRALSRAIAGVVAGAERSMARAATLAGRGRTTKAEKIRAGVAKSLDGLAARAAKAAATKKAARRISAACRDAIAARVAAQRDVVARYPLRQAPASR